MGGVQKDFPEGLTAGKGSEEEEAAWKLGENNVVKMYEGKEWPSVQLQGASIQGATREQPTLWLTI